MMHRVQHTVAVHNLISVTKLIAAAMIVVVAVASFAVGPRSAAAQMEYDYNDDGKVTCADFEEEFPETFTEEATKALEQYPDELRRLNANSEENDVACEGQPEGGERAEEEATPDEGDVAPTEETAPQAAEEEPAPQPTEPAPAAETTEGEATEAVDVPADVMARVEGCAVVAISSRGVVGAGCPGVGTVMFRIPDDAPPMKGTVITNPGAAAAAAATAQESTGSSGSNASARDESGANDESDANADTGNKQNSANSGKRNKDDTEDKDGKKAKKGKDKKDKDKKKGGKNGKKGKKSKKQGKKGK